MTAEIVAIVAINAYFFSKTRDENLENQVKSTRFRKPKQSLSKPLPLVVGVIFLIIPQKNWPQ